MKDKQSNNSFTDDWMAFNGFRLVCAMGIISTIFGNSMPTFAGVLLIIEAILMLFVVIRSVLCGIGKQPVVISVRINNIVSWWLTLPYGCFISGLLSMAAGDTKSGWLTIILGAILMACFLIPVGKKH